MMRDPDKVNNCVSVHSVLFLHLSSGRNKKHSRGPLSKNRWVQLPYGELRWSESSQGSHPPLSDSLLPMALSRKTGTVSGTHKEDGKCLFLSITPAVNEPSLPPNGNKDSFIKSQIYCVCNVLQKYHSDKTYILVSRINQ